MSRKSLYSIHNALPSRRPRALHLELNPAVVSSEGQLRSALSAVCLGPRIAARDGAAAGRAPASIVIQCTGGRVEIESVDLREEPSGGRSADADTWLTVALFCVSRALLDYLSTSPEAEVALTTGRGRVDCPLSDENRGNLLDFLQHVDHPRPVDPGAATGDGLPDSVAV
mgnify:CR=1 FL=1